MNRLVRNSIFFCFGFLLAGVVCSAYAETIAASPSYGDWGTNPNAYNTTLANANPSWASYKPISCTLTSGCMSACGTYSWPGATGQYVGLGNSGVWSCPPPVYTCPANQDYTLSGSSCTRPDCVAPQTRDPSTGLCVAPKCEHAVNAQIAGIYSYPKGDTSGTQWCIDSCSAWIVPTARSSTTVWGSAYSYGTYCQGSGSNVPTPTADPTQNPSSTSPPCAPTDGVVEYGGAVKCVPSATNPQADPPVVNKKSSTQTNPDGSQTITTVTQTCTGEGACTSVTTTTVTAAAGGGAGTAGTPGTTTSIADKPSDTQAKFCAENPGLQICKGGISEEATQIKVEKNTKDTLDEIKKLTNPEVSDASSIEGNTFENTSGREDLTAKDDELKNYASGVIVDSGVSSSKSAWESAMLDGWWESIDLGACAPFQMTFAGRTVVIDHCEKAALISQIGAYGMWIMLAIGSFVMLTGGRNN